MLFLKEKKNNSLNYLIKFRKEITELLIILLLIFISYIIFILIDPIRTKVESWDLDYSTALGVIYEKMIFDPLWGITHYSYLNYTTLNLPSGMITGILFYFLGQSRFVSYVATVLFSIGTLFISYNFLRIYLQPRIALFGIIILGYSPLFLSLATLSFHDEPALFFIILVLLSLAKIISSENISPEVNMKWSILASLGLAGLFYEDPSYGIYIILPLLFALILILISNTNFKNRLKTLLGLFIPVGLLVLPVFILHPLYILDIYSIQVVWSKSTGINYTGNKSFIYIISYNLNLYQLSITPWIAFLSLICLFLAILYIIQLILKILNLEYTKVIHHNQYLTKKAQIYYGYQKIIILLVLLAINAFFVPTFIVYIPVMKYYLIATHTTLLILIYCIDWFSKKILKLSVINNLKNISVNPLLIGNFIQIFMIVLMVSANIYILTTSTYQHAYLYPIFSPKYEVPVAYQKPIDLRNLTGFIDLYTPKNGIVYYITYSSYFTTSKLMLELYKEGRFDITTETLDSIDIQDPQNSLISQLNVRKGLIILFNSSVDSFVDLYPAIQTKLQILIPFIVSNSQFINIKQFNINIGMVTIYTYN